MNICRVPNHGLCQRDWLMCGRPSPGQEKTEPRLKWRRAEAETCFYPFNYDNTQQKCTKYVVAINTMTSQTLITIITDCWTPTEKVTTWLSTEGKDGKSFPCFWQMFGLSSISECNSFHRFTGTQNLFHVVLSWIVWKFCVLLKPCPPAFRKQLLSVIWKSAVPYFTQTVNRLEWHDIRSF